MHAPENYIMMSFVMCTLHEIEDDSVASMEKKRNVVIFVLKT
jgi:hypothetical protein